MLTIFTADPSKLLADIKAAIKSDTIRTWTVDSDGDFSHKDNQLAGRGFYFQPEKRTGALCFKTLFTNATSDKTERRFGYAYLHGHMTAMIVTHFAGSVTKGTAIETTPNPTNEDTAI